MPLLDKYTTFGTCSKVPSLHALASFIIDETRVECNYYSLYSKNTISPTILLAKTYAIKGIQLLCTYRP